MQEKITADQKDHPVEGEDAAYEEYRSCENCNSRLEDRFCPACGQKDVNFLRPVWNLLEDALGDLLSFDSRFTRTLIPLMVRPGHITREYLNGRRVRFVPPFRQYLAATILCFLALATSDIQLFETQTIDWDPMADEQAENPAEDKSGKPKIVVRNLADPGKTESTGVEEELSTMPSDRETDGKWKAITSKVITGWNRVSDNPALMNRVIAEWIPRLMFLLLPVYAFIFKIFYIFSKRYYFEHLIFSLHAHAFVFLYFTVMVVLYQFVEPVRPLLSWLMLYIPVYLLIAMKKVYRQGWFMTVSKALVISFVYSLLLFAGSLTVISYGLTQI
ncbi:DUF3667 domain-containing protein [Emcibacter sp.]|uniref:DUF3667 domain-containing protein n=1 Tax=Emcibacter sp. TaxID=1979954 RepID=UPI003A922385